MSRISKDCGDSLDGDEEEEEDAEEGGTAYWIEGATGEEVRSVWRGQKVHLQVMEVLLHPRATNLPAVVQMVYLQAAIKIFVRASGDCDVQELADVVGVVRCRLPVFMQVS